MTDSTTIGLPELAEILTEALQAAPWFTRVAAGGRAKATVRVMVSVDDSAQLGFLTFDAEDQLIDAWSFGDLDRLQVEPERAVAYAECVARIVGRASATVRLVEQIPPPLLLVLPELITADDFATANEDASSLDRAAARLYRLAHPGPPIPEERDWDSLWRWMVVEGADPQDVERLVRDEPSVLTVRGSFGHTLVHELANAPSPDLLQVLLEAGADVNARTDDGITPLHLCRVSTAPLLLQHGAELEARANDGSTPLLTLAAEAAALGELELLLERGANHNARNTAGRTALDIASARGEADKVALLERAAGSR